MSHSRVPRQRKFTLAREHAGFGVYQPRNREDLKLALYEAIGRTVDLDFAGIARDDERFAGQNLYQEHDGGRILQSSWIPEQDVAFPKPASRAPDDRQDRPGARAIHDGDGDVQPRIHTGGHSQHADRRVAALRRRRSDREQLLGLTAAAARRSPAPVER